MALPLQDSAIPMSVSIRQSIHARLTAVVNREIEAGNIRATKLTRAVVEILENYVYEREASYKTGTQAQLAAAQAEFFAANPHLVTLPPAPPPPPSAYAPPGAPHPAYAPVPPVYPQTRPGVAPAQPTAPPARADQTNPANLTDRPELILGYTSRNGGQWPTMAEMWAPLGTPGAEMHQWERTQENLARNSRLAAAEVQARKMMFSANVVPPQIKDEDIDRAMRVGAAKQHLGQHLGSQGAARPAAEEDDATENARRAAALQAEFDADPALDALFPKDGVFDGFGNRVG